MRPGRTLPAKYASGGRRYSSSSAASRKPGSSGPVPVTSSPSAGQEAGAGAVEFGVVPVAAGGGVRSEAEDDRAAAAQHRVEFGGHVRGRVRHVAEEHAVDAGEIAHGRVDEFGRRDDARAVGGERGLRLGREQRAGQEGGGAAVRVRVGSAVHDQRVQAVAHLDRPRERVVGREVVLADEFRLEDVNPAVAKPVLAVEFELHVPLAAGRDRLDLFLFDGHERVPAGGPPDEQFDADVVPLGAAEVGDGDRDEDRLIDERHRVGERDLGDREVVGVAPGSVHDRDIGARGDALPHVGGAVLGARQRVGPRRALQVGKEGELAARVGAGRPGEHVRDVRECGGVISRTVCRLQLAEFRDDLFGVVGRAGHDGLDATGQEQHGVAVAVVAGADEVFGLRDGALEARLVAVRGLRGHAQRRIDHEDVVCAGHVRDGFRCAWVDLLPQRFGPRRGADHGEQSEQQCERAESEQ